MLRLNEVGNVSLTSEDLISELDEQAKELFIQLSALEYGFRFLRFLFANHTTLRTSDGIAFRLNASCESIERALAVFAQLELVRVMQIGDITLYGLTQDPLRQHIAQNLLAWQDRWATRMRWIEDAISGRRDNIFTLPQ